MAMELKEDQIKVIDDLYPEEHKYYQQSNDITASDGCGFIRNDLADKIQRDHNKINVSAF